MNKNINYKKDIKLYNVLFPLWMILLFPICWLIVISGNFIIDSLVLIISINILKLPEKKQFYQHHILKIFAFGMLADIIGSIYMLTNLSIGFSKTGDEPYLTIPALTISTVLIFVFNYFFTFKDCNTNSVTSKQNKASQLKLSLIFAVITTVIMYIFGFLVLYAFGGGTNIFTAYKLYITIPALITATCLIFAFNYFLFKKQISNPAIQKIDQSLRLKLSLIFAIFTAPYTFLIPADWLYK